MKEPILLLGTYNKGKIREFKLLFQDLPIKIKELSDFKDIPEFEEQGDTFAEIAANKAKFISAILNVPTLSDDSGLEVKSLNWAPGIFSARYAGKAADQAQRNNKLLQEMSDKVDRTARFTCSIAIAKPSGEMLAYNGQCYGTILSKPLGTDGFGYDPLFYYPPLKKTFAQLSADEKAAVSHRGKAIDKLINDFNRIIKWLEKS